MRPLTVGRRLLLWLRFAVELFAVPFAVPLSLLVIAILAILLIPTLIPVAQVRASTKAFATRVFGLLGDTFVVTMSPVRRDLVVNKVAKDIAWLAEKCDALAVVAHSQGAALAHDALKRRQPNELDSFITVGSGIQKLLRLRVAFHNGQALVAYAWIAPALIVAGAAGLVVDLSDTAAHNPWLITLASVVVVAGGGLIAAAVLRLRDLERYEQLLHLPGADGAFKWIDIYASADPVPNGPSYPTDRDWLDEQEVFLHASILRDHTAYLRDDEAVMPLLAQRFTARFADLRFDQHACERVGNARWRRRLRTRVLSTARVLIAIAAVAAGWQIDTTKLGAAVAGWLPEGLRHSFSTVVAPLPAGLRDHAAGGVCTWLLFSLSAYALFVFGFRTWTTRERKMFLCRTTTTNPLPAGGERVFFGGISIALLAAELALAGAIAARHSWRVPAWITVNHPVILTISTMSIVALLGGAARSKWVVKGAGALERKLRALFDRQQAAATPNAAQRTGRVGEHAPSR